MYKEEYKKLLWEIIEQLLEYKEKVGEELQERVFANCDFPSESYSMKEEEIKKINQLRNKEVAIGNLIHYLDKELR